MTEATWPKTSDAPDKPEVERIALDGIEKALLDKFANGKEPPIGEIFDLIAAQAVHHGASDIHFEPWPECLALRFRIDGAVQNVARIPKPYQTNLLAYIKVLSKMPPYKKDSPQDARIEADMSAAGRGMRVSTFPTIDGEQAVLRLAGATFSMTLDQLGFHGRIAEGLREIANRPQGALLLTGPSSSGKTTTIYALLHEMLNRDPEVCGLPVPTVITLEDPIEYRLEQVAQTQLNPKAGFTYEEALRSVLRQDPDVLMVGEIRDPETAQAAIRAGLTGHLVISTIHSGTAAGVFTRLLDMGIEPYLLASAVTGVLAQRLVRANCPHCSTEYEPDPKLKARFGMKEDEKCQRGYGCMGCEGLGYNGRTAIGELLTLSDEVADLVLERSRTRVLHEAAKRKGMLPLADHGVKKVRRGRTTLEELNRVLPPPS